MSNSSRSPDAPPPPAEAAGKDRAGGTVEAGSGIDLMEAVRDHTEWRRRFRNAMAMQETLDAAPIAQDTSCALGQWLHQDAVHRFRHLDTYWACLDAHAAFHLQAARVAHLINEKRYYAAEKMLAGGTAFSEASMAVGLAIIRLKKALS